MNFRRMVVLATITSGFAYLRSRAQMMRKLVLLTSVISVLSPLSARAQYSENVLYDFNFTYAAGINADSLGNLYGAVPNGGADNVGAIFEMIPPGNGNLWWQQNILYSFPSTAQLNTPGTALIFDSQGNLYGATGQGDVQNCGGVFKLSPPAGGSGAWSESVLQLFVGGKDACGSSSLTLDSHGNLYGASEVGGTNTNGVIYELTPTSGGAGMWNKTILYNFTGGVDGLHPYASLVIDSHGNLYGTTTNGGSVSGCGNHGCGTVFELSSPSGSGPWAETTLYTFTGDNDGGEPFGLTLDSNNTLYGSTGAGGNSSICFTHAGTVPGCGGIFELSPPTALGSPWVFTVLHNFSGTDGRGPSTGLTFVSTGVLFGATFDGGSQACLPFGCGLVFSLTPPSGGSGLWTETVLHSFTGQNDGAAPFPFSTVLLDSRQNIYGALNLSETTNCSECGSIYELSPTQLVPSSTALVPSVNPALLGESITFTATVTPSGSTLPTGTVSFASNGSAIAGCSSALLSAGQAVCTTPSLEPGSDSVVAVYSGDATYSESAGGQPENVLAPQLGLTVDPGVVSINAGKSVTATLNLTSTHGAPASATTFACTGLPAGASCSFSPSQVTSIPASVTLTINTLATNAHLRSNALRLTFAFVLALPVSLCLRRKRAYGKRRFSGRVLALLFLVLLSLGCGGSGGSVGGGTIGGSTTYVVVVTASATDAGGASASIDLTVVN